MTDNNMVSVIEALFVNGAVHEVDLRALSQEEKNEVLKVTYQDGQYRALKRSCIDKLQELI